jgi:hypothetical protein
VPISLTRHLMYATRTARHVAKVFDALYDQVTISIQSRPSPFYDRSDTQHVVMGTHFVSMSKEYAQLAQQYVKLWNVTIGKVVRSRGMRSEARQKGLTGGTVVSKSMMLDSAVTMSRSSFSLNSIPLAKFPYYSCILGQVPQRNLGLFLSQSKGTVHVQLHSVSTCLTQCLP